MSMVQQLISAVAEAERQIDEQISRLRNYGTEIDEVARRISAAFSGSQTESDQQMLQQIAQTKKQVDQTIERLQIAKDKLIRIRMI